MKTSDKVQKTLENNINPYIKKVFDKFIPDLIEVYLDTYDEDLSSVVTDRNSLSNPELFYDDYKYALETFEYLPEDTVDNIVIRIPTEDTFDFIGRLSFLQLLVHGTAGKYFELTQEDYDILKSNKDLSDKVKRVIYDLPEFFDDSTPKNLRFYLLHSRGTLYKTVQNILGKKLVIFPFSNSAAIDLFDDGIEFFEGSMEDLVEEAIELSINTAKKELR